jgi:sulfatase maturation enzyme AslB (radical SAM superfamily)
MHIAIAMSVMRRDDAAMKTFSRYPKYLLEKVHSTINKKASVDTGFFNNYCVCNRCCVYCFALANGML